MNLEQIQADKRTMAEFVCERIPPDGTRIVLADGPDGPAWADLMPIWDDDDCDCDLIVETNEPEWVDLQEIYDHFRRREMTSWEREREMAAQINRWKLHDLEKENAMMRYGVEAEMLVRLARIEGKLDGVAEKSNPAPDYSSIKQAAKITGLSDSHIRREVVAGRLPASNIGSASHPIYRIALKDLHEWMSNKKGGTVKAPPKSIIDDLIQRHLPGLRGRKDSATR